MGATAGMRLLSQKEQKDILKIVRKYFARSGFLFLDNKWARVISGSEEGGFLWFSENYLLQNINKRGIKSKTVTTIDVGGASAQISFKVNQKYQNLKLTVPRFN